ncbi:MAG: gliding motility lipoprotein GldH [Lewinellaceae bacterium]|nr:gliding motility lipoprotein GldH [Lewinellaceae bacterium]
MFNKTKGLLVFSLLGLLLLNSCGDNYLFNEEKEIANGSWSYQDTLNYTISVGDTSQLYNLYVAFEHADTFRYQNIYLKLHTLFPDGSRTSRLRSFDLYDIEGKSKGECSGHTCEVKSLLQDNLYFNQIGDYTITLEQFTRSNPLLGVNSVAILMEKAEKKR